jgi:hypothetical protein
MGLKIGLSYLFLVGVAFALPALAVTQSGTTTKPAELRATPFADGKLVATLPPNAKVDVIKRVGGWYEVKAATGQTGFVRMWLLRFSTQASGASALGQNVAVLQSGRASSTYTTATTGVRGLSEEELKNAQPDPEAVKALDALAVTPDDARGYAKKGKLKADATLMQDPAKQASK